MSAVTLDRYVETVAESTPIRIHGRVTKVVGLILEGHGPGATVGEICEIELPDGRGTVPAEVVGFREGQILLMPIGEVRGIGPGCKIVSRRQKPAVGVGPAFLGRILDAMGQPIDGKGAVRAAAEYPLYAPPVSPLLRNRIAEPLDLGVRVLNGLFTCARGQRLGIMAGSGVGKSVLMGMIARYTEADVNVIALIGERGREVREFLEKDLREEGLARSVVIVATSDQSPLLRLRGAYLATTIAEYFRDEGKKVLLMMDSITRFAMAQREVGLAVGEPPTTKGYTPSVFALLPKLLERAGMGSGNGSITGLYTVLVEGDDLADPVADAVRATLDGHIVLSRDLANQNHFPAVDPLASNSRVMIDVVSPEHMELARRTLSVLATHKGAEDLIHIGAYKAGSDPKVDDAIRRIDGIRLYLRQDLTERAPYADSLAGLSDLWREEAAR
ncbi:MAG: FliI/YscN family ATPase [Nitrospirae bacterium]|nr:FliI/YscN family ATPase [Nitrospirota bacterium]